MNGNDEAGDKPDLESNEPNPKRARIDPEISNEKIHENTNDIGDTQEKDTSMKNTENDELGKFNIFSKNCLKDFNFKLI